MAKVSESLGRTDELENHLNVLYTLLEDVLYLQNGTGEIRNTDVRKDSDGDRPSSDLEWLRSAVGKIDELVELLRRNIQKSIALDALPWLNFEGRSHMVQPNYRRQCGGKYSKLIRPSLTDVKEPKEQARSFGRHSRRSRSHQTRRTPRTYTTSSRCSRKLR